MLSSLFLSSSIDFSSINCMRFKPCNEFMVLHFSQLALGGMIQWLEKKSEKNVINWITGVNSSLHCPTNYHINSINSLNDCIIFSTLSYYLAVLSVLTWKKTQLKPCQTFYKSRHSLPFFGDAQWDSLSRISKWQFRNADLNASKRSEEITK